MNGLFGDFMQYLRDVSPGGVLNPELQPIAKYGQTVANRITNPNQAIMDYVNQFAPPEARSNMMLAAAGLEGPPQPVPNGQERAQGLLAELMPGGGIGADIGGLLGHTVYHGSPHKFDAFDLSKIGTGEGAQAYGHGLYFAENPKIAKSYQEKLSASGDVGVKRFNIGGDVVAAHDLDKTDNEVLNQIIAFYKGDSDAAYNAAKKQYAEGVNIYGANDVAVKKFKTYFDRLADFRGKKIELDSGSLYTVEIPDEVIPKMLDWDKPLSEQPDYVKKVLQQWQKEHGASISDGEGALREIAFDLRMKGLDDSPTAVSEELRKMGIPGIRYLDAGSRGAGKGTSNFVLFDDSLAKIVERK